MTAVVLAHPASSLRPEAVPAACRLAVRGLDVFYGTSQALKGISLEIPARQVTAIIGPSGCGKSTLLRVFNRIHELQPGCRANGQVLLDGEDILSPRYPLNHLRSRVGMVFQKPVPFPMSIFENIAWGIRHHERPGRAVLAERVEEALRRAALWDEVKDRLGRSALALSGGQQQRLCIARSIALRPEVLLLDEPTSALDPVATARIEQLIEELKTDYTLVMVTHNMQQAARISDRTAFLYMGELIEAGATRTLFNRPAQRQTADYIAGRFG